MKRVISALFALILLCGCGQEVITPHTADATPIIKQSLVTATPIPIQLSEPSETPASSDLPSFAPAAKRTVAFAEELLWQDGEPFASKLYALLLNENLTKESFRSALAQIVELANFTSTELERLGSQGRTLTEERATRAIASLHSLCAQDMLLDLKTAYEVLSGSEEPLPLEEYVSAMKSLIKTIEGQESRELSLYSLGDGVSKEYLKALSGYMGETMLPKRILDGLETLAETEAYALNAALTVDPEAVRKKEDISFGSLTQNLAFLTQVTRDLCPSAAFNIPRGAYCVKAWETMDILHLAFYTYPGMLFIGSIAADTAQERRDQWQAAPDAYLAGLAVNASHMVTPYLADFGLDYVQYRWYEEMLETTLTGICALLIHYYGYSLPDLAKYLDGWGAADFAEYLYDRAQFDPFECLVASYGYICYLDICQATLDAGCPNEKEFLQTYLQVGPAPFEELKQYMVSIYQNKVDNQPAGE